jgi:hypothetical protein
MKEGQTVDDTNSLSEAEDCDRISSVLAQVRTVLVILPL